MQGLIELGPVLARDNPETLYPPPQSQVRPQPSKSQNKNTKTPPGEENESLPGGAVHEAASGLRFKAREK